MRYCGGKSRIAGWLAEQIAPFRAGRRLVEPFCGGLSATVALQPQLASDASVPLIHLIRACRRNFARCGRNALLRKITATRNTEFRLSSYDQLQIGAGDLVYCDPPYSKTTFGYSTGRWDADRFWVWARGRAEAGAIVVVSEFSAPPDVELLATKSARTYLHTKHRTSATYENLYILRGGSL